MKKELTARELRKKQQKKKALLGLLGGLTACAVAVGLFIFSQGDSLDAARKAENKPSKGDTHIETVDTDGSDPNVEGTTNGGIIPITDNIPELVRTPRVAWDAVYSSASNAQTPNATTPSENLNYLWSIKESSTNKTTYIPTDTNIKCSITYENQNFDGQQYVTDKEATQAFTGWEKTENSEPIILWTSYNLRIFYDVIFEQQGNNEDGFSLARVSQENNVAFTVDVHCDTPSETPKVLEDATKMLILIVPVEVN